MEKFSPGELLMDELIARKWSQGYCAEQCGLGPNVIGDILAGRKKIDPEIAAALSRGFGTSAQYWLNLQAFYDADV